MRKLTAENSIHNGHRARMRAKLLAHGQRIFDTYELLEMLLYYVIPYKDTNPTAKHLLEAFGNLDGVLSAGKDELLSIPGIGERTAEFIAMFDELDSLIGAEIISENAIRLDNYDNVGEYLVKYFHGNREAGVAVILLDNDFRIISVRHINERYNSAAVRPKLFIDMVISTNASVVITAQNKYYGAAFPTVYDRETTKMITSALRDMNILHAEHYVISGKRYNGILNRFSCSFAQYPAMEEFFASKDNSLCRLSDKEEGEQ